MVHVISINTIYSKYKGFMSYSENVTYTYTFAPYLNNSKSVYMGLAPSGDAEMGYMDGAGLPTELAVIGTVYYLSLFQLLVLH